jgi:hypothetical protein
VGQLTLEKNMIENHFQGVKKYICFVGILIWIVVIVATYYLVHKPISLMQARNMLVACGHISIAFGLVSLGGWIGKSLMPKENHNALVQLALQAALGLGILSIGFFVIGSLLGLHPILMWALSLLLAVVFNRSIWAWYKLTWKALSLCWPSGRLDFTIVTGIAIIIFATLLIGLAPPLKFDTLVYHLTLPRIYLQEGNISYLPQLFYWGMPQVTEMLYTWALALAGEDAAIIFGWLIGLITLLGVFGYVRQLVGARAAWVAIASLLAGFTTASSLAWGYVGWMSMLYGLAFLASLESWVSTSDLRYLFLAAIFSGLALGAKYTNGVLLLTGIVVIIWAQRKNSVRGILLNLFQFVSVTFLVFLPWLVKNYMATGNPAYPFFFPAGEMSQVRLALYQGQIPWGDWRDAVFLPFRATIYGLEGGAGYSASVGPLLLALGPFAWVGWRIRTNAQRIKIKALFLIAMTGLVVWAITARLSGLLIQTRLYLALFPIFAILAGVGFDALSVINFPKVRLQRIVSVMVVLVLCLNVFAVSFDSLKKGAPQNFLSLQSDHDYLVNNLGWYTLAMDAIRELPSDAHVLMLWEPRSFYCQPLCDPDEVLDRWLVGLDRWETPSDVAYAWQEQGFSHILYYQTGAEFVRDSDQRYQLADWQALDLLLSDLSLLENFGDAYILYSLDRP